MNRPVRRALALAVAGAICAIAGLPVASADEPPVRDDCFVGKGPGVAPDGTPCRPANPKHSAKEAALITAKSAKAEAYREYKAGRISKPEFDAIANRFWALSGEEPSEPSPNQIARRMGHDPVAPASDMLASGALTNFWPFEQFYNWQCGPATSQSILYYKTGGPSTSAYAPDGSQITGNRQNDQWILGYSYYTNANASYQTSWSPQVVDRTLNRWRTGSDSGFYITGSVTSWGGDINNLTKSDVMAKIEDDIDFDWPVAENVEYGTNSYRPAAFPGPNNWQHWDTVYGYFDSGGVRYVQIGQVWGSTRFYNVAWDTHWAAIGNYGHGIVY